MAFINQLVRLTKPNTILEIGTAIGYSALIWLYRMREPLLILSNEMKKF